MKVTPKCRYGHGDLFRVTSHGAVKEWALISPGMDISQQFQVGVFACKVCGYIELFDLDIETTLKNEGVK